ncbi:MAG TPA: ATP-grasp domain-containing protein [Methylophilus sp.]|nr:ATP-grasp domain-containing protein [Methylophilus sp.]HQQ33648.1 ATP-grasp domain-containing protein [Methylophilus sp.]
MSPHILIIAYSARAYAQMAVREGFYVTTLDAFADADTRALAQAAHLLRLQDGILDVVAFKSQIETLQVFRFDAVLYGSIFDAAPDGLCWLEQRAVVKGNPADTLKAMQNKVSFFKSLQQLEIPIPKTWFDTSAASSDGTWLVKRSLASGGSHVRKWRGEALQSREYLQQQIDGVPVSLLFHADGQSAHKVGFNRLLMRDSDEFPFQFAGAVSRYAIPEEAAKRLLEAAEKLTWHSRLQGINSLDAMLVDENIIVLELNPRLSASATLYPTIPLIRMQLGLQADDFYSGDSRVSELSHSEMIIYADRDSVIPENIHFPEWVADIPVAGQIIPKHNPVCTVQAHADTPDAAHELLMHRYDQLKTYLEL